MRTPGIRPGHPSSGSTIAIASMLVALLALVLSVVNPTSAAPTKGSREEVQLLATVTGSAEVAADDEMTEVQLDHASFTQEAGTTIELVTNVTGGFDPTGGNDCIAWVAWNVPGVGSFPDTQMNALGQWMGRSVFGITPVDTARDLELSVATSGGAPAGGACQDASGGVPKYHVTVEVAVLALR